MINYPTSSFLSGPFGEIWKEISKNEIGPGAWLALDPGPVIYCMDIIFIGNCQQIYCFTPRLWCWLSLCQTNQKPTFSMVTMEK